MVDTTDLKRWHAVVDTTIDMWFKLAAEGFPEGMSSNTIFAAGQVLGALDKVRSRIAQDLDDVSDT